MMLFAVNLIIEAEKTLVVEARSKADAAAKARKQEMSRKHLLEQGDFRVICGTSSVREVRGSNK
jgi:hypothetical protein